MGEKEPTPTSLGKFQERLDKQKKDFDMELLRRDEEHKQYVQLSRGMMEKLKVRLKAAEEKVQSEHDRWMQGFKQGWQRAFHYWGDHLLGRMFTMEGLQDGGVTSADGSAETNAAQADREGGEEARAAGSVDTDGTANDAGGEG